MCSGCTAASGSLRSGCDVLGSTVSETGGDCSGWLGGANMDVGLAPWLSRMVGPNGPTLLFTCGHRHPRASAARALRCGGFSKCVWRAWSSVLCWWNFCPYSVRQRSDGDGAGSGSGSDGSISSAKKIAAAGSRQRE